MDTATVPAEPEKIGGTATAPTATAPSSPEGVAAKRKNIQITTAEVVTSKQKSPNKPTPAPQLTAELLAELAQHEAVIVRNLETFYDVGRAFASIRDNRLYNPPYATFEEYLEAKWGITRQRGSQLIRAADMITAMSTRVSENILPRSERVARELLRVSEDNRVQVLELAHKKSKGKVTAEDIASAKETIEPRKKKAKAAPKKAVVKPQVALKAAEKLFDFLSTERLPDMNDIDLLKLRLRLNSILGEAQNKRLLETEPN